MLGLFEALELHVLHAWQGWAGVSSLLPQVLVLEIDVSLAEFVLLANPGWHVRNLLVNLIDESAKQDFVRQVSLELSHGDGDSC